MKISFDWLKQLAVTDLEPAQLSVLLTRSGLEVEGIEDYEQIPGSLEGLVIGEVLTCDPHPNADKLKVTTVDAGTGATLHIVCGAPNVQKGQKVVIAKEGVTLHPVSGELFTIKKTKIRGETSEGMICAEDEIGSGKGHDGIIVLDTKLPNGTPLTDLVPVLKDEILEIGLTPNRADATSHWGVARDIRALTGCTIQLPPVEPFKIDNDDLPIEVTVENPLACPRYSGITISGVTISESPDWLKSRLRSIGLSPINNVVDITNFILHETGQPLHAFDYDRIGGKKVIVKTLPENTLFITLDGVERKLRSGDLMICDSNEGMCIAGVFGGSKSGVSLSTKNIFLESANFSADYIRKTVQAHDLKTDASFRFERGTDPNMTVYALKRAAGLIKELAGGKISSEVMDVYPEKIGDTLVGVKYKNVYRLIGKEISPGEIKKILALLDIRTDNENPDGFTAHVPPYRVDVTREADIIEEILRIYGYDNIPLSENLSAGFLAGLNEKDPIRIHGKIAHLLSSRGFNEILTNSLTSSQNWNGIPGFNEDENVEILNRISDDLGILRQSLLFTGLPVIAYNLNHKQKNLKLFEIGKTYRNKGKDHIEKNEIAVYWTGDAEEENWTRESRPVAFHDLYGIGQDILQKFNIRINDIEPIEDPVIREGLNLLVNGKTISSIGLLDPAITEKAGIRQEVYFMKMDFDLFLDIINTNITFREVPKFPEVRRDLSLVIDRNITFRDIMKVIIRVERRLIRNVNVFDFYEGENIEQGKKAYALSFILQDPESTLTDKVIDKTMNRLMETFEKDLGAKIRK
jgi:phenylalanyl-tRNA synthetase beta chain